MFDTVANFYIYMKHKIHWNTATVQNAWNWYKENYNILDMSTEKIADHWYDLFGCEPNYSFPGYLEFESEEDYMIFLLKWS